MVRAAARLFKMSLLSLLPPTISYGGLLPKALSLEMALNWLYLNVTAAVIVDYVAGIDPKAFPLLQGPFPICPQTPRSPGAHDRSSAGVSSQPLSPLSSLRSGGLDFLP